MASSSSDGNFRIETEEGVEAFVEAVEELAKNPYSETSRAQASKKDPSAILEGVLKSYGLAD